MGDISIIARRISDEKVEYGWSGNGGYFRSVGFPLLEWYNTAEKVDYVFSLGQCSISLALYHHKGKDFDIEKPVGSPHCQGVTERELFSKIAFVDYGYFYDGDNEWYYVIPGPFRIKIPLWLVNTQLDEKGYEFDFKNKIRKMLVYYIFHDRYESDEEFREYLLENNIDKSCLLGIESNLGEFPLHDIFSEYKVIYDYFDDWVVIKPITVNETNCTVKVIMKKKSDKHIETLYWDEGSSLSMELPV